MRTVIIGLMLLAGIPSSAHDLWVLGREKVNRGKEPTYESPFDIPVITIPNHDQLKRGTQKSIFNQLEDDFIAWEQKFDRDELYVAALETEKKKRGLK